MHDKSMTESGIKSRKTGSSVLRIKHGSAVVPIYTGKVRGESRYTVAFHLNGRRIRRTFGSLNEARQEAQLVARRIQQGLAESNDLSMAQRENYLTIQRILEPLEVPPVSAVEEYASCRKMLGEVPLLAAVMEFVRRTKGMKIGVKAEDILEEFLESKRQDLVSQTYLNQLSLAVRRFCKVFHGEIMKISTGEIDKWLRGIAKSPVTRNSIHRCIKVFFAFAKARGYLPQSEATAAELLPLAKEGDTAAEIFQPVEMRRLLAEADGDLIPYLAIGGFAGLRVAEIGRLDWDAVDLSRKIITLRADQAKTASRRIVPISENLCEWLLKLPRKGRVMPNSKVPLRISALAKRLKIRWPHNALRHSYISYRIAEIKDAARVALEAGNSAEIIFKHYRELVTEQEAQEWFSILPPQDWSPPPSKVQRRKRR